MISHETFWAVVGTAAPVIALAAILSAGESASLRLRAFSAYYKRGASAEGIEKRRPPTGVAPADDRQASGGEPGVTSHRPGWRDKSVVRQRVLTSIDATRDTVAQVGLWVNATNVTLQTIVLTVALANLVRSGPSAVPPLLISFIELAGMVLLAAGAAFNFRVRALRENTYEPMTEYLDALVGLGNN